MRTITSLTGSAFERIRKKHGLVEAVNRFFKEHGCIPAEIAESELARELKDAPDLMPEARACL